jgi:hypothetical protein
MASETTCQLFAGPSGAGLGTLLRAAHLAEFLSKAREDALLAPHETERIERELTQCWYGYRTLARISGLVLDAATGEAARNTMIVMLQNFDAFRIKHHDLRTFTTSRPWARPCKELESG